MPNIAVIGSANIDFTTRVSTLPQAGETLIGSDAEITFGGKGANQAVAAARLGADVKLVAKLGKDEFSNRYLEHLKKEKINTGFVVRESTRATGTAFIVVDEQGSNMIVVSPGANMRMTPADVERAQYVLEWADMILVQLEIPLDTVYAIMRLADRLRTRVMLNAAPLHPQLVLNDCALDVLLLNEVEAAQASGIACDDDIGCASAAVALRQQCDANVVITRGSKRTCCLEKRSDSTAFVDVFDVEPVDTVGAGDTFGAALGVALCRGLWLRDAVRFANAAAALATTRRGAQTSMPRNEDVEKLMRIQV